MWQDNNDKILDILDAIDKKNKECFPVVCPICGRREGHLYFHRYKEGGERGSTRTRNLQGKCPIEKFIRKVRKI